MPDKKDKDEKSLTPWGNQMSLRDAMSRLFDESFWSPLSLLEDTALAPMSVSFPKIDISETKTLVKVKADLPGVDPKNLDIEVENNHLKLSGKTSKKEEERDENFYRVERSYGEFSRTIPLPAAVKEGGIKAVVKNGVLTITLKKEKPKEKQKIKIDVE